MRGASPLRPRGDFAKLLAPATHYAGAPREHGKAMLGTRVTFPSRGKSPKARQGLRPLESPWCKVAALAALAYASRRAAFFYRKRPICHFEHVGKSVSFFPLVPSREHPLLSIRGTVGVLPSRMPQAFLPTTNTARAAGRGIKGGEAPFAGGPGTRRFLAYLCLLSLREKVGRGLGRSAQKGGRRGCQPRINSRVQGGAPSALGECRGGISPLANPRFPRNCGKN